MTMTLVRIALFVFVLLIVAYALGKHDGKQSILSAALASSKEARGVS